MNEQMGKFLQKNGNIQKNSMQTLKLKRKMSGIKKPLGGLNNRMQ